MNLRSRVRGAAAIKARLELVGLELLFWVLLIDYGFLHTTAGSIGVWAPAGDGA